MTNWCDNLLRVNGPATELARFKTQAIGFCPWDSAEARQAPEVLNFHSLVPVPVELWALADNAARCDWLKRHWGCVSGAFRATVEDICDDSSLFQFLTAWSPPVPFLESVSRSWPSLVFVLDYEEQWMAFKGLARAAAGSLQHLCVDVYPSN